MNDIELNNLDCEAALIVMGWPLVDDEPLEWVRESSIDHTPCVTNWYQSIGGTRRAYRYGFEQFVPTRDLKDAMMLVERICESGWWVEMDNEISGWCVSFRKGEESHNEAAAALPLAIVLASLKVAKEYHSRREMAHA